MTTRQPYTYVILRYVHDVVSREFINVGVVVYAPKSGDLQFRTRKTIGRLKGLFPNIDREVFSSSMRAIDTALKRQKKSAPGAGMFTDNFNALTYALKALPHDDSALQWSECRGGLGVNAEAVLDRLYERHVARYDDKKKSRKTDEDVWKPVRESLKVRGVNLQLESKTLTGDADTIEFERAWKNGRWHAYEPLTMDLADADGIKDKARKWRGHLDAVSEGMKEDVRLHFILGRPAKDSLNSAYEQAKTILKGASLNPEIYEDTDVDTLVNEIEDHFRAHQASQSKA
jgi:hypothetical protein